MDYMYFWGSGEHLTAVQMSVRSFCMFFILLALLRVGGMRIFGKKSAFDSILVILLGAVLARGVVGASPYLPTVAASAVLVIIHRILGWLAMKYKWVGKIVKGEHRSLYRNGVLNIPNMEKTGISDDDIKESLRLEINSEELSRAKEIVIEKNGHVSVIKSETN